MRYNFSLLAFFIIAVLLIDNDYLAAQTQSKKSDETISHHNGAHKHMNHAAFFAGWTTQPKRDNSAFTIGADYTRKIGRTSWSIGVLSEIIFYHHTEGLILIPFYYQINEKLWLRSGPGIEFYQNEHYEKRYIEFVYRVGIGSDIETGNLIITPSLDLDVYRSAKALVVGINIGTAF